MSKEASYTPLKNTDMKVAEAIAMPASATTHRDIDNARAHTDSLRTEIINRIEADIRYHKSHPRVLLTPSQMNRRILKLISSLDK